MPQILTFPRAQVPELPLESASPGIDFSVVFDAEHPAQWRERADAEHDEAWLQPIPYVVLRNSLGEFWSRLAADFLQTP